MSVNRILTFSSAIVSIAVPLFSQAGPVSPAPAQTEQTTSASAKPTVSTGNAREMANVVLGPGDRLTVAAPDIEELDRRILRIQADGSISVPMVGPVKAAGLTPQQLSTNLNEALKSQFRNPRVTFTQIEVRSKAVTVLGAVNSPGVVQSDGRKHLLEVLSMAGGLKPEAGPTLTLTRKATQAATLPADLKVTRIGNNVTAVIPVTPLLDGREASNNIAILPGDVITVPKGRMVYVVGDVRRSGAFVVGETNDLSVLKALSLAQGLRETAAPSKARILRASTSGPRAEEQIDLKKLLAGKIDDIPMKPDDILFVPGSLSKKITSRTVEAMVQTGTGYIVYR